MSISDKRAKNSEQKTHRNHCVENNGIREKSNRKVGIPCVGNSLLRLATVKGPVTRIIDPLFLSLCPVLPLSKIRAAKTASLDVSSEARYSPRKFMQNTHLMLVSDLSKLLGLIAGVSNGRSLSFSSFTVSWPRRTTYPKISSLGSLRKKFENAKIRDQHEMGVLHKLPRAVSRFRGHVKRCGFRCSDLRKRENKTKR